MERALTVLVPTYEHDNYLHQAIDSILLQETTIPIYIYIFVDFSENKTSLNIANNYSAKYKNIKVYENKERLFSGTKSFMYHCPGVESEFWAILEGDDYWLDRKKVLKQIEVLDSNSLIIGSGGITKIQVDDKFIDQISIESKVHNLLASQLLSKKYNFYIHTSSIIWRNKYRYKNMPLPKLYYKLMGDPGLKQSMMSDNFLFYFHKDFFSVYRKHDKGAWSSTSKEDQAELNKIATKRWRKLLPLRIKITKHFLDFAINDIDTFKFRYKFLKFLYRVFVKLKLFSCYKNEFY